MRESKADIAGSDTDQDQASEPDLMSLQHFTVGPTGDLSTWLAARGLADSEDRLRALGVEGPADVEFLSEEELKDDAGLSEDAIRRLKAEFKPE